MIKVQEMGSAFSSEKKKKREKKEDNFKEQKILDN